VLLLAAHAASNTQANGCRTPARYSTLPGSRTSTNRLQRNAKRLKIGYTGLN
jgi:hypothetical protein